ncbi:transposase [Streptomyces sp. NPDC059256]|uniref:transposase n=1 Tax=Streptomyces sp. NPDC059256 TaxID=3346794 RepID=UPI0036772AB0
MIDRVRVRVRTGVPWRNVPAEFGPWGRVEDLFRRWSGTTAVEHPLRLSGTVQRIPRLLQGGTVLAGPLLSSHPFQAIARLARPVVSRTDLVLVVGGAEVIASALVVA